MATRVSVRGLTEGAILAALVALFAVAARYLPLLGTAAAFVCPLPLTALVIRHGLRVAVLAAAVAAAVAGIIAGPIVGGVILLAFAPLGIVLGVGSARGWSAQTTMLAASAVGTAGILANLGITLALGGVNPYIVMIDLMRQNQEKTAQFYQGLGVPREVIEEASGRFRQGIDLLPRLIPALIVLGGIGMSYLNMVVGRAVLGRVGSRLPQFRPIREWEVPAPVMWLFILGFVLTAWGGAWSPVLETTGLNLIVLVQLAFMLQGLIVGWILMERYGAAVWLRWIALFIALTNPLFQQVAFFLGLADSAFFLRERWRAAASRVGES